MDLNYNSKNTINKKSDYVQILYLVIFIAILFFIYKFIYSSRNNEPFNDVGSSPGSGLSLSNPLVNSLKSIKSECLNPNVIQELKQTKKDFDSVKDKIFNRIKEHDQAVYISNNFNKINPDSFDKEKDFLNLYNNDYPSIDLSNYKLIKNQSELNNLATQASNFKNIYSPGEIVDSSSDFNIDKNKICYQQKGSYLDNDPNFIKNYPQCMVCSINPSDNYKNMPSWDNTKTNIKEVCLFNPNPEPNSGIPNLDNCKKLCSIS